MTLLEERIWRLQDYQAAIKRGVYGLWSGKLDASEAFAHMWLAIEKGLMWAWYSGASECGISPDELSTEERAALGDAIYNELYYLERLIYDVARNNKASGYPLSGWNVRLAMWTNRYNDVVNRAKMMACGDQKLKWNLGPTKEHCNDCSRLNGKVKRASTWAASGWTPQGHNLECKGYLCQCSLDITTDKLTPGRLPKAGG